MAHVPTYLDEIVATTLENEEEWDSRVSTTDRRLAELGDRLRTKVSLLQQRMEQRHNQERSMKQLSHLYGKWLTESDTVERQRRLIHEALVADQQTLAEIEQQLHLLEGDRSTALAAEESVRQGKLGDFFGADTSQLGRDFSPLQPTHSPVLQRFRGITKLFGRTSERPFSQIEELSYPLEVIVFLEEHPGFLPEGCKWVRDGPLLVQIENGPLKERRIFLFSHMLVIAKKKNGKDKIKGKIPLAEARAIFLADNDSKSHGFPTHPVGVKNAFQIVHKSTTFTFTCSGSSNIMTPLTERNAWFYAIRSLIREFQRTAMIEQKRGSLNS